MKNLQKLAELAQALPETVKDNAVGLVGRMGEVIEGFGDAPLEWRPDTLKLVQGTSDRSKLPKGANIGSFVLGEDLVEQPLRVIPIRSWTSRQYWDPNPDNAKMLCNSPDAKMGYQYGECGVCAFAKFDEDNNKSQCNKTMSFLCVSEDLTRVFVVNFSKTNYMGGVDWLKTMKTVGVAPYKRVYNMSSQTSTKSKNVELIKVEAVPKTDANYKVEGALLAFVEELFRISQEDRQESLVKFYEYVKTRKERNLALEAPRDVVLLGAADSSSANADVTDVVEVAAEVVAAPSGRAGKYKM
jgi:hypothetical protein